MMILKLPHTLLSINSRGLLTFPLETMVGHNHLVLPCGRSIAIMAQHFSTDNGRLSRIFPNGRPASALLPQYWAQKAYGREPVSKHKLAFSCRKWGVLHPSDHALVGL